MWARQTFRDGLQISVICFVRLDFTVNVEEQRLQWKYFDIISNIKLHQGEFSLVASIKVKFLASVTKNVVLSF